MKTYNTWLKGYSKTSSIYKSVLQRIIKNKFKTYKRRKQ